ncbi:glutamate-1-semialdehyde 2,1-aminomutase [Gleimia hominis]|uniref:glutamate-1-semialdehyde 2,1-aminomutase n=1 Tax=Gleimia hominis TaxID=595468 RepID=UPI000C803DA2|nr:glutamate-1-semialdehyde 2,1-aminomutase [Gleimia hominis]WIK64099.1 glutamate-1-semialdehyde 2,1-aminomutase [Gleimia hominis]
MVETHFDSDETPTASTQLSNKELFEAAKTVIPGGVDSPVRAYGNVGGVPRFIESAGQALVRDVEGQVYVDLVGSWGPALLGHCHPEVVEAVKKAAEAGLSFGAPTASETRLAQAVQERVPCAEKLRFVSTGTEATMTAIRLARGATNRDLLVKFAGCYHGHSDSLLAEAGSGVATAGLPGSAGVTEGTSKDTIVIPYGDTEALRAVFEQRGNEIAAVITEAAPANMGVITPPEGFNQAIREITSEHGALMIFDEVLTGFRVSPSGYWGYEALGEKAATNPSCSIAAYTPDIFTFGKVIGGGMPLAAVGGRAEYMDLLAPLGPVYQAGTLSGNPLATAAGLATLELATPLMYERINSVSSVLRSNLAQTLQAEGVPFTINNAGNLFSLFLGEGPAEHGVHNYEQAKAQNTDAYRAFFHAMLDEGIYLPPSPFEAWFVSSAHTDENVGAILDAFGPAARAAAQAL